MRFMKRFKLVVAYDGTNYCGWQIQPNGITVEEVLNKTLSRFLKEEIHIIGASRTDSGVHSFGNVAVFDSETTIPPEKLCFALNPQLPEDIRIVSSEQVPVIFIQDIVIQEKHTNIISKMGRFLCQQKDSIPTLSFSTKYTGNAGSQPISCRNPRLQKFLCRKNTGTDNSENRNRNRSRSTSSFRRRISFKESNHPSDRRRISLQYGPHY